MIKTTTTTSLPKVIWEERVALTSPIGYNGMPQIHFKTANSPSSTITTPV